MTKKIHYIALIYQDITDFNYWVSHSGCTRSDGSKIVCEYAEDEFHYYFCRIEKIKERFCGMQLNGVQFLGGKYYSDDINFILSRVRL